MKVLDCILSVYAANYLNFLLLQQLHTLAHFIEAFESLPVELQVRFKNFILYFIFLKRSFTTLCSKKQLFLFYCQIIT